MTTVTTREISLGAATTTLARGASTAPEVEVIDWPSVRAFEVQQPTIVFVPGVEYTVFPPGMVFHEAINLQDRIVGLESRVAALEQEVKMLKSALGEEEEVVVLRDLPKEQAKDEIRKLLASGETLYMSDIADRLHLLDQLVVEICRELLDEGEVEINDDVLRSQ